MILPIRDNAPGYEFPIVNLTLIFLCAAMWAWQLLYPGGIEGSLLIVGEIPARILAGAPIPGTTTSSWLNLLTSMFAHGSWDHIIGNMYALWLFGDNIEWVLGRWRYLGFYLLCGLLASVATVALGSSSTLPGVGASGAIAGVLGAYWIMYPRARVTSIMWVDPWSTWHFATGDWGLMTRNISANWYMGSWVVFQILLSVFAVSNGVWLNLGIYAHAAGAIVGMLLIRSVALKDRIPAPEHHTQSAAETIPVFGEAGDAGGSYEPVNTLGEELTRLKSRSPGRRSVPQSEFDDHIAEDLISSGLLEEAELHCLDMLQIARKQGNAHRTDGYQQMVRSIRERKSEIIRQRREEMLKLKEQGQPPQQKSYQQKLDETKGRLRRKTPDWL